ncbi:tyrosine-type recombinase/integrase [Streptomyces sp. bgisy034]|uniref:tyrosine-type recombinase/integrase n=1 Tax=Streptomyces sp. bgisy034 TaxID=3413774 RepID=UPI003EBD51C7
MARRNANGEGTIYRRKDGRYEGAVYVLTTSGTRKRVRVYGATRAEVSKKLTEAKAKNDQGIPVADRSWKLGEYLDYWLEEVVKPGKKPKTYEQYELVTRRNLKPSLGQRYLSKLTVRDVQTFINQQSVDGYSARRVEMIRNTLSSALTRAMKEELVNRNVARLVDLKAPETGAEAVEVAPWSFDEVQRFLSVARTHRLYPAFLLALFYGMRRGEILGLAWKDINLSDNTLSLRQQLQRVGRELLLTSLKTKTSRRDLPLVEDMTKALEELRALELPVSEEDLVFRTNVGTPIEPRNFVRTFWKLCEQSGVRIVKFHHLRHSQATMLEHLQIPVKTAQAILGHSSPAVTQQIYQHGGMNLKRDALELLQARLRETKTAQADTPGRLVDAIDGNGSRQVSRQSHIWNDLLAWIISGGPRGARTLDTLLKRSTSNTIQQRITEVDVLLRDSRRHWLIGIAAVSVAVKRKSLSSLSQQDVNRSAMASSDLTRQDAT